MADTFDPYQTWLDIASEEQPPDHYRLLGIQRFEKRLAVIEAAAVARIEALQQHRDGPQGEACQRIVGEITAARLCLTNDNRRAAYDANLYKKMAVSAVRTASAGLVRRVSAEEFIEILAAKDLLPPAILVALRGQFADSRTFTPAEDVIKLLVAKGLLTRVLADRLLETAAGGKLPEPKPQVGPSAGANDELTFAPEESPQAGPVKPKATSASQPADKPARPLPKVSKIADRGPATLLEDPTLGGALSAKTPKLKAPRKKSWFSWLRLPQIGKSDDAWIVWLAILAVVSVILFLGVLIYSLRGSAG